MYVPGVGFFPFFLACALATFSAAVIARGLVAPHAAESGAGEEKGEEAVGPEWPKAVVALVTLVAFACVLERAGYAISTFAMTLVLLRMGTVYRWLTVVIVALVIAATSYFAFSMLGVRLPVGSWLQ